MMFFYFFLQQGRLSDDDSADTLDELDPPSEKGQSLNRTQTNEEQKRLPTEDTIYAVLPSDARYLLSAAGSSRQFDLCYSFFSTLHYVHYERWFFHDK